MPNGQEFVLNGEMTIGRSVENDIKLSDDSGVSRKHAKLEVRGKNVRCSAIAHTIPFDDPKKTKRTAIG